MSPPRGAAAAQRARGGHGRVAPSGNIPTPVVFTGEECTRAGGVLVPSEAGGSSGECRFPGGRLDLEIVGIGPLDTVWVDGADATTWQKADGSSASYDAATRTRVIGIPTSLRGFRVVEGTPEARVRTVAALPLPVSRRITWVFADPPSSTPPSDPAEPAEPPPLANKTIRRLVLIDPPSEVRAEALVVLSAPSPEGSSPLAGVATRQPLILREEPGASKRTLVADLPNDAGVVTVSTPSATYYATRKTVPTDGTVTLDLSRDRGTRPMSRVGAVSFVLVTAAALAILGASAYGVWRALGDDKDKAPGRQLGR